ncbi:MULTISPECIES: undecaprenyldiphospho-muramoylpentapeptide beta-N-acetylglucosaminyltransferase [Okeania]|uniref:UDP-N-acetylglucosamine--N-acetylmuramyl-(pentapeptide) pyrophosphoryl-undecaprenol N-acetylglucosamine transferase n=1 Tax=Okeania hirsuta TaxID=1458930 RepID=A0A3N6PW14_9CYAN|nr:MULTISPECIES: undecaprenyldiphospho-muramoylpentapeptide beta-N-acetylglucosaminyltransferase [Okeania]NES88179.1 undecaprenyldiphospho-muramoylpentapeptide beta-N-acetylglucosaminyltransferase [Okeania sp. SIO2B9]NET75093.1 undecaprenyldiphospho-muramoylpentapeptide beta-N-acetylglucosaminyltransferase [Okeania sp. SIO1F9]RQH20508.1 undecaprenyldiphospho-muramoylpentapeptide beta-N-acetylglucosaminyltransferase [Okeania hirsuta]RQH49106.1 undecaprenyldiphospho-muramoylpentapeptide beta-N-ac
MTNTPIKLLIAASGTGGHLFPAIATAKELKDYQIEWLGVPNRLETKLVPSQYPLHTISVEGFQQKLGLGTLKILSGLIGSILKVRHILKQGNFQGLFTTGGYIAAPAIIAARSLGLPVILHESNVLPGKVTRWFSSLCNVVALGFEEGAKYLPNGKTVYVGTPVREQFLSPQVLDIPIPENVPVIAVVGGSQGAVSVNQLVRECVPAWVDAGAWIIHQTGENDRDAFSVEHPQYFPMTFYNNMAGLFQRANLVIGRAGAGTLTELAVTHTPSILIPYPYAADNHQVYNANVFANQEAAIVFPQSELTSEKLETVVLELLNSPEKLEKMNQGSEKLAVNDSAKRLANLVDKLLNDYS